ncbi:hypothetical protein [Chryseobacterium sp. Bi04]|uniref:hypothetical protein n=1 Tax=Chryseobacterium sp. Bi04 TaxID=2822345 RepID=UPI001E127AD8|nr:hypothetical protein [Chryseobacterium sp. Bi04]CAH0212036.1 hypothetical protein SRABI04_02250 [Chryseobacterium sp. Bi04]
MTIKKYNKGLETERKTAQNKGSIRELSYYNPGKAYCMISSVFLLPFFSLGNVSAFIDGLMIFLKIRTGKLCNSKIK